MIMIRSSAHTLVTMKSIGKPLKTVSGYSKAMFAGRDPGICDSLLTVAWSIKRPFTNDASASESWMEIVAPLCVDPEKVMFGVSTDRIIVLRGRSATCQSSISVSIDLLIDSLN